MSDYKSWTDTKGNKIQLQKQPSGAVTVEIFDRGGGYFFGGHPMVTESGSVCCGLATRAPYKLSDEDREKIILAIVGF